MFDDEGGISPEEEVLESPEVEAALEGAEVLEEEAE